MVQLYIESDNRERGNKMRITKANLEGLADTINYATNSPMATYTKASTGYTANPGNFHIGWAYGGCKLVRVCNNGGGISDITKGFCPKSETYYCMLAYLDGIREGMASK